MENNKLTEKDIIDILAISLVDLHGSELLTKITEMANELLKYKQLEEQIGCPLDVVFNGLKNGFYFNNKHEKLVNTNSYFRALLKGNNILIQEYIDNGGGCWYKDYMYIYLKDYKKTWWLKKDKSE